MQTYTIEKSFSKFFSVDRSQERILSKISPSHKQEKKQKNVSYVVKNNLCVGCGVCQAACPNNAISISSDSSNVPEPTIDETTCNSCGLCLKVCYGYEVDNNLNLRVFGMRPPTILGNSIACYTGYACKNELRYSSSSGGVVTALLINALKRGLVDGAIVTAMELGYSPKPKAFIATTYEEVLSAQGSKYAPVSLGKCLKNLSSGKKYAVVGLPCHIYGIRKLSQLDSRMKNSFSLYIGIVCGGMPSYLGTNYILRKYKMEKKYITKLEYRGNGWPGRLLIQSALDGSDKRNTITVPYPKYWYNAFNFFVPYRCTLCHDAFNEFSDISLGDAWLRKIMATDKIGTSLIVVRTNAGRQAHEDAVKDKMIITNNLSAQDAKKSQSELIKTKCLSLRARTRIAQSKFFERKLPSFNLDRIPSSSISSYMSGIWLYVGAMLAGKKNYWRLFDMFVSVNSFLNLLNYLLSRFHKVHIVANLDEPGCTR